MTPPASQSQPDRIEVTRPHLPSFDKFVELARGIWDCDILTNQGPLLRRYEDELATHLGCEADLVCVANGGLALQILLRALDIRGELITTPFSYVATTACPVWEGCRPRFADIDPDNLCLDPAAVEAGITSRTEAILATHVFGNPGHIEELAALGRKHGIAVIFDAAHAFGVRHRDRSILDYGDGSIVSLHATKMVHSGEGGLIATRDADVAERSEWMRRFGHENPHAFRGVGINAKMSELHAALGLCVLEEADEVLTRRKRSVDRYLKGLERISGIRFATALDADTEWNAAYMPVIFDDEAGLLRTIRRLDDRGFGTRRYFHPSLDLLDLAPDAPTTCPCSREISQRILCLPLSSSIADEQIDAVLETLEVVADE